MHLLTLMLVLFACGGSEAPAPEKKSKSEKAAPKERKSRRDKVEVKAPVVDPDLSGIPAKAGELVGCPPGTTYKTATTDVGQSGWCENGMPAKHGNWLVVFPDGQRAEKGGYLDGKEDGSWSTWYAGSQKLASRGTWDRGKRVGRWLWWSESGTIKEEGDYLNGRRAGLWVEYEPLGKPWKEGMYVNDLKHGAWTVFQPGGEEKIVAHFEVWERGILAGEAPATDPNAPAP